MPKIVLSDNAPTFVLAEKTIQEICDEEDKIRKIWGEIYTNPRVQEYSTNNKIEWKFLTPLSPWKNGAVERMIGV